MVPERSMIHSRQQTPAGVWGELRHVQIDRRVERLEGIFAERPSAAVLSRGHEQRLACGTQGTTRALRPGHDPGHRPHVGGAAAACASTRSPRLRTCASR